MGKQGGVWTGSGEGGEGRGDDFHQHCTKIPFT